MADTTEKPEFVIRHNGYFYRPNAQGYTASVREAGRWTKAEAELHRNDDPLHRVTVHHASEFEILGDPLETLEVIAIEIFDRWDKDQRPGKLLLALAGRLDGYRPDVDALRSFLKAPEA